MKMGIEDEALAPARRVVRMGEACRKTGLCQSTLYSLIARGLLPKPFQLVPGGRAVGWFECDLDAWLTDRSQAAQPCSAQSTEKTHAFKREVCTKPGIKK